MSLFDYRQSLRLSADDPTFAALVMALIRKADSFNRAKIDEAWPEIAAEMQTRYDAPRGVLPGEVDPEVISEPTPTSTAVGPDGDWEAPPLDWRGATILRGSRVMPRETPEGPRGTVLANAPDGVQTALHEVLVRWDGSGEAGTWEVASSLEHA